MSDIQEQIKIAHRKALEQDFNEIIKELKQEEHKNLELSMRINKAIEYIEYEMPCLWEVDEIFEDMDGKDYNTWKEYDENKLLNILKGGDNNE